MDISILLVSLLTLFSYCCFLYTPVLSIRIETVDDVYFRQGHPLVVDCKIRDDQGETVQWTLSDGSFDPEKMKVDSSNGSDAMGEYKLLRLTLEEPDQRDAQAYHCKVKGPVGDEKFVYANIVSVHARGANVTEGMDATLRCSLKPVFEEVTYTWLRDGEPVDQIPGLKDRLSLEQQNTSLTIQDGKLSDAGVYTCKIHLMMQQTFTEDIVLQGKPYMEEEESVSKISSSTSKSLTLWCPARGYPKPDVFWLRGDDVLEASDKYVMKDVDGMASASLEIIEPKEKDFGDYVCTADNSMGKADITFHVVNATVARLHGTQNSATLVGGAYWSRAVLSSMVLVLSSLRSI